MRCHVDPNRLSRRGGQQRRLSTLFGTIGERLAIDAVVVTSQVSALVHIVASANSIIEVRVLAAGKVMGNLRWHVMWCRITDERRHRTRR